MELDNLTDKELEGVHRHMWETLCAFSQGYLDAVSARNRKKADDYYKHLKHFGNSVMTMAEELDRRRESDSSNK